MITDYKNTFNCYHCGDTCENELIVFDDKNFCCNGCKTVYEILNQNNLSDYYSIENTPGIKNKKVNDGYYKFLEIDEIANPLFEFIENNRRVVRLFLPEIHCTSCVWLLENLNKLNEGIVFSEVNFLKKEALISFNTNEISFKELAILLHRIGYEPKFDSHKKTSVINKKQYFRLGVTLFCFGNVMLFSFPEYLNPDETFLKSYRSFFTYLILGFSIPVLFYSAKPYLVSAFKALRAKTVNLDVPITLGILTLYFKSAYDIFSGNGPGYMDSFVGFILFLLIGKWFQDKTYQALSFNRNYQSYFPLAVTIFNDNKEEVVPVEKVKGDDIIIIKNEEIIPADSVLIDGKAHIDYSFVTGESDLIRKVKDDQIYAGGKQVGATIKLKVTKALNQSYLTQLWNQNAFKKDEDDRLSNFNNKLSNYFIVAIIIVAITAVILWSFIEPSQIINVVVSVLIVACPCALALSIPFTFGNSLRIAGNNGLYLKNSKVVENLGKITDIVFDKTGTLTSQQDSAIQFMGENLSLKQEVLIYALVRNSSHPISRMLTEYLKLKELEVSAVKDFKEVTGKGVVGVVDGIEVIVGSSTWVGNSSSKAEGSVTYVKIGGEILGYFKVKNNYREGFDQLIKSLDFNYNIHLLSGDNDGEKDKLKKYFTNESSLNFNQKPIDKLNYIKSLKEQGKVVMMVGDGLNDAGALKQSDIGIVIAEDVYNFSPACDGILDAKMFSKLPSFIHLGKYSLSVLKVSYTVSLLYNIIGLSFAFTNQLSPVVAAILMPLSSISVVLVTSVLIRMYGSKNFNFS